MALKGFLQSTYQNVLNLDDLNISDHNKKEIHFPFVKMRIFANNLQLINRLQKEGKMNKERASEYIERQKRNIRITLLSVKTLNISEIENTIEKTVNNIVGS